MLAIWAAKADARLALNEISPLRRDCLNALFPAARVTGHNAELIDELLDPAIIPSVVLMNPPYSHGIERGHDSRTGARHLRSAWNRLASGGDRKSVVEGKSVSVRVDLVGRRTIKKKITIHNR